MRGASRLISLTDDYTILMRRQGWKLLNAASSYATYPDLFDLEWLRDRLGGYIKTQSDDRFYKIFGDNTARKILRSVMIQSRSVEQLQRICSNKTRLDEICIKLSELGLIEYKSEEWVKGIACNKSLQDIGPALEWYICEWFSNELESPTRYKVYVEDMPEGGDLDVVSFVNDIRVFVECKSGNPANVSDKHLRLFLQRTDTFMPEIALLLIDTDGKIDEVIARMNIILQDMQQKSITLTNPHAPPLSEAQKAKLIEQVGFKGVYQGAQKNIYVAAVPDAISETLSLVLRLYHSRIRHQLFIWDNERWDYINGQVVRIP